MSTKKVKKTSIGKNHSALSVGKFSEIKNYIFFHPRLKKIIPGKIFLGKNISSSSCEISLQNMPPKSEIPFFHKHNNNEEIYIILKGNGQFQIDNEVFDIEEGSVIRVDPDGKRSWRNNSDDELILMVIQSDANSLKKRTVYDGLLVNEVPKWHNH